MRRLFLASVVGLLAVVMVTAPASAGRAWCRADPILIVDDQVIDIQVASSLEMYGSATGPIKLVVTVPRDTNAFFVLNDLGFLRGYETEIKHRRRDRGPIKVEVLAPAQDSSLPVSVHATTVSLDLFGVLFGRERLLTLDSADGQANEWVTLKLR